MWDDKSHGSMTQRAVTSATGNKIDPDKHRLMHMHAPTLYTRRYHNRPATNTKNNAYLHIIITHTHTHTQIRVLAFIQVCGTSQSRRPW